MKIAQEKFFHAIKQIRSLSKRKAIERVQEERKNTVAEKSKRYGCEPIIGCHFKAKSKLWDRGNLFYPLPRHYRPGG